MENEWLELAYINYKKVIMHGQIDESNYTSVQIEQVLTKEQARMVEDLNHKQRDEMHKLLRSFIQ